MSKLKLGFFGDGPWSHEALLKLLERRDDFEVKFVAPRFDYQDPELCQIARANGLEVKLFDNVNSADAVRELSSYNLDVIVSMSFNQIFKSQLLEVPRIGTVNCHAGALPNYRGRNVLNWALINGETELGVTAHFVDTGIDTGDIICQEMLPIPTNAKYADVLELAYDACPRVLISALDQLREGTVMPLSQNDIGEGFYCGRRIEGDEWIDWSWPAQRIVNFIRAISPPGPGAITAVGDQKYVVLDASFVPGSSAYLCTEGEVVGRDEYGVWVKASDRTVRLELCYETKDTEIYVPQWRLGTRLLNQQSYRLLVLENKFEK
jgi:methionyl-tRNA formyltransferase